MKTTSLSKNAVFAATVLLAAGCFPTLAHSVPPLINYQGKLLSSNGLPVATGDYELRFRIYDSATNGSLVWGPQIFNGQTGPGFGPKISVVQGWLNAVLGPVDTNGVPITAAFISTNRFFEIQIGTNPPVRPRQQILSAPYALHAEAAASLIGGVTSSQIVDGAITQQKLAPRAVGTTVPAGGVAMSTNVSIITNANGCVPIPGLSVTIETTGRPVILFLTSGPSQNSSAYVSELSPGGAFVEAVVCLYRGTDPVGQQFMALHPPSAGSTYVLIIPTSAIQFLDTPPAGTNTYSIRFGSGGSLGGTFELGNVRLVAYEL